MADTERDAAYAEWSYGQGWTDGRVDGTREGFAEGYTAGFDAGAETGAARILLALQTALGGQLPDLLPDLPHVGAYTDYRARTAYTAPTDRPEYRGGPVRWETPR